MPFSTPVATPIILAIIFPVLAVAAVVSRFYARHIRQAGLGWDDWMLIPSLSTAIGSAVVTIIAACYGQLGKNVPLTPEGTPRVTPQYILFQKCFVAHELLSTTSVGCTRFALLLLYSRVFSSGSRRFKWALWTLYILNVMWTVTFFFVQLFNCYPVEDAWNMGSGTEERHCLTPGTFAHMRTWVISSVILDAFVLTLPWFMVMRLQLSASRKAAVLGIFMLGLIVVGTAIGKIVAIYRVTTTLTTPQAIQHTQGPMYYWTMPETCIAIICACLPTMRPVVTKLGFGTMFASSRSKITTPRGKSQISNLWPVRKVTSSFKNTTIDESESIQHLPSAGYKLSVESPGSEWVGDVELHSIGTAHAPKFDDLQQEV